MQCLKGGETGRDTSASQGTPASPGAASPEVGRALSQDIQKEAAGLRPPSPTSGLQCYAGSISGPTLCCSGQAALGNDVQTDGLHLESLLQT